jgi:hypothetical protein
MLIAIVLTFLLPILLLAVVPIGMSIILHSLSQTVKWELSLILASCVAFLGYFRLQEILAPQLPIPAYIYWALKILAIISPTCIAVAWLRWNGVKWWHSLLLFPLVPIGMISILLANQFPFAS